MAAPALTLRSPGEIAAVVPYLTGFVPHESLVAIGLRKRRVGLTMRIDLADLQFGATVSTTYTANGAGGTLRVTDGSRTASLALLGTYSTSAFTAANDGAGHVLLSVHG